MEILNECAGMLDKNCPDRRQRSRPSWSDVFDEIVAVTIEAQASAVAW